MDKIEKQIYLVGGAVRDKLLGKEPTDLDYVVTGYTPETYEETFPTHKRVGSSFPIYLDKKGNEIALARAEHSTGRGYNDFATSVDNISIESDLQRRDLTINSIAQKQDDTLIDPYGGILDITNKVLRHTSEAFREDPLRVLRLARFKTMLPDFTIHVSTKKLVKSMKDDLTALTKERVWKEVEKVMKLENSHIFYETLLNLGVLYEIFPQIANLACCRENSKHHKEDSVFAHSMMVLNQLKDESIELKLTAVYHDIAKYYCYLIQGNANGHESLDLVIPRIDLNIPNKYKKPMLTVIENHIKITKIEEMTSKKIAKFLYNLRKESDNIKNILRFYIADSLGRITDIPKKTLPEEEILEAFNRIQNYSPLEWIKETNVTNSEQIKQHIHRYNIGVVNDVFRRN